MVIAATFGLCLAIILGAYWAFVVIPEDKSARQLIAKGVLELGDVG